VHQDCQTDFTDSFSKRAEIMYTVESHLSELQLSE